MTITTVVKMKRVEDPIAPKALPGLHVNKSTAWRCVCVEAIIDTPNRVPAMESNTIAAR
ncbi:MAG: hypothetical protein U5L04_05780 [Trueperaceae bacterium]|nr:hypothetical protein [Trueperaceae bacterium]